MTAIGWLQIVVYSPRDPRAHEAARDLHVPGLRGRAPARSSASSARSSAALYAACGVDPRREQTWLQYTFALLAFSAASLLVSYAIFRLQALLPLNPQGLAGGLASTSRGTRR